MATYDVNLQVMASINEQSKNILILYPLYDYGENPNNPYKALTLSEYEQATNRSVKGYFNNYAKQVPVMFLAPGSATNSLYEHLNVFNKNYQTVGANPTDNLLEGGVQPSSCSDSILPGTILSQFLTPPENSSEVDPLNYFMSQCKRYSNSGVTQSNYFNSTLKVTSQAYKSIGNTSKNLIGITVYKQRDLGFYAVTCSKNAHNLFYSENLHKQCLGFYPETPPDEIWQALSQWQRPD